MSWKSKYFILFKDDLNWKIKWPEGWGNQCPANLAPMLQEVLKTKAVGSELKLIWNWAHERDMITKYEITYQQLYDYVKANVGSLHFQSEGTRKRAVKALLEMGATNLVLVDNYRDLLLYQAHFRNTGEFPIKTESSACA